MIVREYKLGTNRGRRRLWLQGKQLARCGFHAKRTWYRRVYYQENGKRWLALWAFNAPSPTALYKVSGKGDCPIIDINDERIGEFFGDAERVEVEFSALSIIVRKKA